MARWFGSSGIRGSFIDLNPEFAINLGMAVGSVFQSSEAIFIASDIRSTSDILKSAFMSGFSSVSGPIIDIGLLPTPILSYVSSTNNTLGVMITASHNPPSNNGFKFFFNGGECDKQFEEEVEKHLEFFSKKQQEISPSKKNWKNVGKTSFLENKKTIDDYMNYLCKRVTISHLDFKIVLDCANNVPNIVSPLILQKLGFKNVITINDELNSSFPGRPSEPAEQNLKVLKRVVIERQADIGIAHDGDGDRFAIINEKGEFVNSTSLICLFLDHLDYSIPEKQKIVLTSDCTQQAFDIVSRKGGTVITSRIGRNRDFVNDKEILFLAEPNKVIFPELGKWIDGIFPVLKLLQISKRKALSKTLSEYNKRNVLRKAFEISPGQRGKVQSLIDKLPSLWSSRIRYITTLDGLKLYLKDEISILIRFSGTEPKIKFYIESSSASRNEAILTQIISVFHFDGVGRDC